MHYNNRYGLHGWKHNPTFDQQLDLFNIKGDKIEEDQAGWPFYPIYRGFSLFLTFSPYFFPIFSFAIFLPYFYHLVKF